MMSINKDKNDGRFVKGTSGNPAGRPRGSCNQSTLLLEGMLESEAPDLIRKVIELAKEGNIHALGLCMERLMPRPKDRTVRFPMPPIKTLNDTAQAISAIVTAVSEGDITPQEGEALSRSVSALVGIMVNQDLQQRVERLEQGQLPKNGAKTGGELGPPCP